MVRKLAGFSLTAITVVALLLPLSSGVVFDQVFDSATGSGQIQVSGDLRTFTFNANTDSSGVTTGQTQGYNRNSGVKWHGTITCLYVVGNVATMSGVVTDVTPGVGDPFLVGNFIQFQVIDICEGKTAAGSMLPIPRVSIERSGHLLAIFGFPEYVEVDQASVWDACATQRYAVHSLANKNAQALLE